MKFLLIPILICGVLGNVKYENGAYMVDLMPINCYGNVKQIPNTAPGNQAANAVTDAGPASGTGHSHAWWWDTTVQRPCFVRATYKGPGAYSGKHPIMVTVLDLTVDVLARSTTAANALTTPPSIIDIKLLDIADNSTQGADADWADGVLISSSSNGITSGASNPALVAGTGFCDTMAGYAGTATAAWGTTANRANFHLGLAADNTDADGCKANDGTRNCDAAANLKHKQKCITEQDAAGNACVWEAPSQPRGWCSPVIATLASEVYAPTIMTSNGDVDIGWANPDGSTAALNSKIDNNSYLYWNFQVAANMLESTITNATRVYFVLGSAGDGAGGGVSDSTAANGHLVFMFGSDTNAPAQTTTGILNDGAAMAVSYIWLVRMREQTPAGQDNMTAATWIDGTGAKVIDAYISAPTSTDCNENQCPANVFGTAENNYDNANARGANQEGLTPAGLTQAWVAVTLPVLNNDAITQAFYILSCTTNCALSSGATGIRGTTYIPAGTCSKTAPCNLSFFSYDVKPAVGAVVADGISVCAWPSGIPCNTFRAFSTATANKNLNTDVWVTTEQSSNTAIETINNSPVVTPGTTRAHIYAEHNTTTKGYLKLATNDNAKNYPILLQANNNSQRGEDIRGWMSEVVEFKDQASVKPLNRLNGGQDATCLTGILGNCDAMVDQTTEVGGANVADTGGAYHPDLAGGTEYPAAFQSNKDLAGAPNSCSTLLARGCGAYGPHKGTFALRALWPHAWKLAGFQFVSTTYRQFQINEFSFNFNSNLQPPLVTNAMSRATVWGTDGASAATTPAAFTDTSGLYKFQGLFQWQPDADNDRLWRIYMQEPTTGSTVPKKIFTEQKLVGIREFLKTTLPVAGATYVKDVRMSTGNAPALATANDWGTGDAIRSVVAYENYGDIADAFTETSTTGGTTFDYAPKYTFTNTYGRKLGISLDQNANNENAGGRIFLVNKNRIINRVLGSCDRPAWHDNDADSNTGGVAEFGSTENYDTIQTPEANCLGLGTVSHCALFALSGSLIEGEYEVWYQHLNNSMPYLQTDSKASIEVKAYDEDKFDFIDSATMCVGAANCVAPNLTFDNEFGTNDTVVVKFGVNANAVVAHDDMVGYIVYFETAGVAPPTSIDRKDVVANGPYDRWIRNCYGLAGGTQSQARTKDQLTTTANIRACIAHHGNGTYYVYVQIDGAKKYVKQSSSFTVAFNAAYTASGTNLVKQITFKNVTAQVEAVGPPAVAAADGEYLFDDMQRTVCNRYASRGSKKASYYNANNNMSAMEVKLKAGVGGIHSTTQCYLRLYKDITCTDPVDTPNGQSPIGVAQVFDPITGTQLSGACQSANVADMTDNDVTNNNHYQIPPFVAKQLGPNMCIRLYSRLNNAQWALQSDENTKIVLNGYTGSASATLVSKFSFLTAATDITSAIGGSAISFSVNIPSPEAVTGNSQDTLLVCIKPVLSGTQNDFFIRYYDSRTTFCTTLPVGTGADQTVSKTWSAANSSGGETFYPGSYELYAKWDDINSPASQVSNYCEKMTKQQTVGTIPILWTQDAGVTAAVAWAAENGISTEDSKPAAGWADSMGVTLIKSGVAKTTLLKYSGANIEPYRVNITYQLPVYSTGSYQLYWSKGVSADDLCNCSLNRCTLLHTSDPYPENSTRMQITNAAATWPSVGKPGCQFSDRTYATDFPEPGKYYLCVNKTVTNKGHNVTVAVASTPTNVSLHINPEAPTPAPTVQATAAVSPAMRITTIISAIIAVIGVLML